MTAICHRVQFMWSWVWTWGFVNARQALNKMDSIPAPKEPLFGHLQQALARYEPGAFHNDPGLPTDHEGCKAQHLCFTQEEGTRVKG